MSRRAFNSIRIFMSFLLLFFFSYSAAVGEDIPDASRIESIYGYSESGRPLTCIQLGQNDATHNLLLVFGVHGFEDAFDHDGEVLRMIALRVIDHFQAHPEELKHFRLCVVPCANPDGLLDGTSHNGFGSCNASGLNINRDFPIGWQSDYHSRNKTGLAPFSTAEARALRDLALQFAPTYAADIQGWINGVYGKGAMTDCFSKAFDMNRKTIRSGGTLAQWLASITDESILLELPANPDTDAYVISNSQKLVDAIQTLCALHSDL